MEFVNVKTQAELDVVVAAGGTPVCRNGSYEASGSATVWAYGSATVRAYGSATVWAYGSATVWASGSATVRASDSATVRAYGSATVRAYGSATVRASSGVAVHRFGDTPTIAGGVLIQVPKVCSPQEFCDYYGLDAPDGHVTMFKVVGADWSSTHGSVYTPGETVECDDWSSEAACGNGLHFCPRPFMGRRYSNCSRFVACRLQLDEIVVIAGDVPPDKVKAPRCEVLYEVDEDGRRLTREEVSA